MLIFITLFFLPFVILSSNNCYIPSIKTPSYCQACNFTYYSNQSIPSTGLDFPSSSCVQSISNFTYNVAVYVSNNTISNVSADGSIQNPFTNLMDALISLWRNTNLYIDSNVTIFLLNETHQISSQNIPNPYIWLFRRIFVNFTLMPLECKVLNISGCFQDIYQQKPTVFLETDNFFLFVSNNFTIKNVIFDGSGMSSGSSCTLDQMGLNSDQNPCGMRGKTAEYLTTAYALFNLETILDDKYHTGYLYNLPSLSIYNCEFKFLHSTNNTAYISLFSGFTRSHSITLENTVLKYLYFPGGIYRTKTKDTFYETIFTNNWDFYSYMVTSERINRIYLSISSTLISNFNAFDIPINDDGPFSLFYVERNWLTLKFSSCIFANNTPLQSFTSESSYAILSLYNSYYQYGYSAYLYLTSNHVKNNSADLFLQVLSNFTSNVKFMFVSSSGNLYSDSVKGFALLYNATFNSNNDVFSSFSQLQNLMVSNRSFLIFNSSSFQNMACLPIASDSSPPSLFAFQSLMSKDYDLVYATGIMQGLYATDGLQFNSTTFISLTCPIMVSSSEVLYNLSMTNLTFDSIMLPASSNLFEVNLENFFFVSSCTFRNIEAATLFQINVARNISFLSSNFANLSSSILYTTLRVLKPQNMLFILLQDSYFNSVYYSKGSAFIHQDFYSPSGAYISQIQDVVLANVGSNTLGSNVLGFSLYLEGLLISGLSVFEPISLQVFSISAPVQGDIYNKNSSLSISESTLQIIEGEIAIFLNINNDFMWILLENCEFQGGGRSRIQDQAFIVIYSLTSQGIRLQNCSFIDVIGSQFGCLLLTTNSVSNFSMKNCSFNSVSSGNSNIQLTFFKQEPLLLPISPPTFGILSSTFESIQGTCISLTDKSLLIISNTSFHGIKSQSNGGILLLSTSSIFLFYLMVIDVKVDLSGGVISATNSNISIISSNFTSCVVNSQGALIFALQSSVLLDNVLLRGFQAGMGAGLYLFDSETNITNSSFIDFFASSIGGHFYIQKGSLLINNSIFQNSTANFQAGSLFLQSLNSLTILSTQILNNTAINKAVVFITQCGLALLQNLLFQNNKGEIPGVGFEDGETQMINCNFSDLTGSQGVSLISSMGKGKILMQKIIFTDSKLKNLIQASGFYIEMENVSLIGLKAVSGDVFSGDTSQILISFCYFSYGDEYDDVDASVGLSHSMIDITESTLNAYASEFDGGWRFSGIQATDSSNIIVTLCRFYYLLTLAQGASLSLQNCVGENIVSSSFFFGNKAQQYGTVSAIIDCNFTSQDNEYVQNQPSQGSSGSVHYLVADNNNQITALIGGGYFQNNTGFAISAIGLILLEMKELSVSEGRVLQVIDVGTSLMSAVVGIGSMVSACECVNSNGVAIIEVRVENCYFTSFWSYNAGAIFAITGTFSINLLSSRFFNNTSNNDGGVLSLICDTPACLITVRNCSFVHNTANQYGGVFFHSLGVNVSISSSTFSDNEATSGNEIASVPINMMLAYINGQMTSQFLNLSQELTLFQEFQSGSTANFSIQILDEYLNFLSLDSLAQLQLSIANTSLPNPPKLYNNKAKTILGTGIFHDFQLIAPPGFNYSLILSYNDQDSGAQFSRNVRITVRLCLRGEQFSENQCIPCNKKSFLLHFYVFGDRNDQYYCQNCPDNAICQGYDAIIPDVGYWRAHENSTRVVKCANTYACPSQDQMLSITDYSKFQYNYICGPGYQGNLCGMCQASFGTNSNQECVLCSTDVWIFIRFAFLSLVVIVFLVVQAKSALSFQVAESKKRSFLKIIVDHFAFNSFISRFNIDWGTVLDSYFKVSDNFVNTAPQEVFNFSCFLSLVYEDQQTINLINLILVSFSPVLFIIVILCFWYTFEFVSYFYKIKKRGMRTSFKESKEYQKLHDKFTGRRLRKNLLAIFLVVFYNFYPRLILNAFFLFKCIDLDNSSITYLEKNPDLICWDYRHFWIVISIGIPNILIWGIGTPFILSFLAFRLKKRLDLSNTLDYWKDILSFMTIDYRENSYYWESILFLQKLTIVAVSIFTSRFDAVSQGGLMIFSFLSFFLLYEHSSPSKYPAVNLYRVFSYLTTISTGAFAILASNDQISDSMKLFYLACIVAVNTWFYIGWIYYYLRLNLIIYHKEIEAIVKTLGGFYKKLGTKFSKAQRNKNSIEPNVKRVK